LLPSLRDEHVAEYDDSSDLPMSRRDEIVTNAASHEGLSIVFVFE
jgi:hypothetical protein